MSVESQYLPIHTSIKIRSTRSSSSRPTLTSRTVHTNPMKVIHMNHTAKITIQIRLNFLTAKKRFQNYNNCSMKRTSKSMRCRFKLRLEETARWSHRFLMTCKVYLFHRFKILHNLVTALKTFRKSNRHSKRSLR